MNKIVKEGAIWDLHIHTCDCPKSKGDFSKLTVKEYVDELMRVFEKYDDLKMISFTDHNYISKDVYTEFYNRKTNIKLLPGIEVDIKLNDEDKDYKHLLFYFDDTKFQMETHSELINKFLNNSFTTLEKFMVFLLKHIKVPFLISPHFMKQEQRAIDSNWDDIQTAQNLNLYIDQLFCFWETSGISTIQIAKQFLEDFNIDNKVSVISFSDSNKISKLESYLINPTQYFNSLASFEGLRLAGSDVRRITRSKNIVDVLNYGNYIAYISSCGQVIELSPKLNVIIGGRGSGKSILLDSIKNSISPTEISQYLNSDRIKYIESLDYKVLDNNKESMKDRRVHVDYFNQGFIHDLFDKGDCLSTTYFGSEFKNFTNNDVPLIRNTYKTELFSSEFSEKPDVTNITSLVDIIKKLPEEKKGFKFKKVTLKDEMEFKSVDSIIEHLNKPIITNKNLLNNEELNIAKKEFIKRIYEITYAANEKNITENNFEDIFTDFYKKNQENTSNSIKSKKTALNNLKNIIEGMFEEEIERVKIINALLKFKNESNVQSNNLVTELSEFRFSRELYIEPILLYLQNVFIKNFDSNKCSKLCIDKNNTEDLYSLIIKYCYSINDVIMISKTPEDIKREFINLTSMNIKSSDNIYYTQNGVENNIKSYSPGTKANILMEYIVFKDTTIPLLIDQPEDNIDNFTIYNTLTTWFINLKQKRQIIVATHDANIVVNADAENIVICRNEGEGFTIDYGALEYGKNIEVVSTILDGGKDAIERRIIKYGTK